MRSRDVCGEILNRLLCGRLSAPAAQPMKKLKKYIPHFFLAEFALLYIKFLFCGVLLGEIYKNFIFGEIHKKRNTNRANITKQQRLSHCCFAIRIAV